MNYVHCCAALLLLCASCSKNPRFLNFTEEDARRELTNGIPRGAVVELFGEPAIDMELDSTRSMLRFKPPHQSGSFYGLDAFFEKDRLTHWRAWTPGEP